MREADIVCHLLTPPGYSIANTYYWTLGQHSTAKLLTSSALTYPDQALVHSILDGINIFTRIGYVFKNYSTSATTPLSHPFRKKAGLMVLTTPLRMLKVLIY